LEAIQGFGTATIRLRAMAIAGHEATVTAGADVSAADPVPLES
jgi:hypothetical protein